nr:MAG TPA: hypothetical protein [Crassvirales sp.]
MHSRFKGVLVYGKMQFDSAILHKLKSISYAIRHYKYKR